MCVRTKISYGCGHIYKTTTECHEPYCQSLEKFHIPKDLDCRSCKSAGEDLTRGREGKGRYAREINRRLEAKDREPLDEISDNIIPKLERLDVSGGPSPWAPPTQREKEWQSPTRKRADDAWLEEHQMRLADLESRYSGSQTSRFDTSPRTRSPREEDAYENGRWDEQHDYDRRRRDATRKPLQYEIRSIHNEDRSHSRSRSTAYTHRRRDSDRRQDSYDSIDSIYRPRSAPRSHVYTSPTTTYDYHDRNDSGYGSYGSQEHYGGKYKHGYGAKTEPYDYYYTTPQKAQPYVYEIPVSTGYGEYHAGYGVDVVQRSPMPSSKHRRW